LLSRLVEGFSIALSFWETKRSAQNGLPSCDGFSMNHGRSAMSCILTVEHVSKSFGKVAAVHNLSFEMNPGEIWESSVEWCRKTTLFVSLRVNQTRFPEDPIRWGRYHGPRHKDVAWAWQTCRSEPFVDMTVFENVLVGAVMAGAETERRGNM
jgi:ABC-type branched-subunit amino acid transport system ATPase component